MRKEQWIREELQDHWEGTMKVTQVQLPSSISNVNKTQSLVTPGGALA